MRDSPSVRNLMAAHTDFQEIDCRWRDVFSLGPHDVSDGGNYTIGGDRRSGGKWISIKKWGEE